MLPVVKYAVAVWLAILMASCDRNNSHSRIRAITVEVTGDEYNWYFRYPGEDGLLGTEDDRFSIQNLYLPDNSDVTLNLKSKDYVYNLAIPSIGEKEIAVPDLDFNLRFDTSNETTWALRGDQFCGFSHETLIGKVFVRDQSDDKFYNW